MELKLFPKKNFDKKSIESMNKIIEIAKSLLSKWKIKIPKNLEFYDDLNLFIKRILNQVEDYGLNREQSIEFIKASLNSGTYGTFDIQKKSIIEMNFNPYFKDFYPAIHFLKLIIHESLHLFLYSNLGEKIYSKKFKFDKERYIGSPLIIQLDEGFAEFFTEKILEGYNLDKIKKLPIYCSMKNPPIYKKIVSGLNIEKFNNKFDEIYKRNSEKGREIVQNKFKELSEELTNNEKIKEIINLIERKLLEHK